MFQHKLKKIAGSLVWFYILPVMLQLRFNAIRTKKRESGYWNMYNGGEDKIEYSWDV